MNVENLVECYETQAAAADAINVSRQAVSKWKESGIPIEFQIRWELDSGGKVRADLPDALRYKVPDEAQLAESAG